MPRYVLRISAFLFLCFTHHKSYRDGKMKKNLFVKPDEQSQTCLNFAMAKKGLMKLNVFLR